VGKYGTAEEATDEKNNMANEHCMLDNLGYTQTQLENETLIVFPRQKWLRERGSMLHYTYTHYQSRPPLGSLKRLPFIYLHAHSSNRNLEQ
jgi:hypothetical protein